MYGIFRSGYVRSIEQSNLQKTSVIAELRKELDSEKLGRETDKLKYSTQLQEVKKNAKAKH